MNTKTSMQRTAAILMAAMILFSGAPAAPARAMSLDITSAGTGTWEATAWPNTLRSGTITVTTLSTTVTGTDTAFLTELSVGNILKTTGNAAIGTVASINSDTQLTVMSLPDTARDNIAYHAQGVGPADNVTIANGHSVTIAAAPVNQTGSVTVNSGGTLNISNPNTVFNILSVAGAVSATNNANFGELTVNDGGTVDAIGNGTYTASSLTIDGGGTANIWRNLTVDSAVFISGTINFSSTSGIGRAMTFLGPVILNSGAAWNEPALGYGSNNNYGFFDDFTNNAAVFTASSLATHTFAGNGKTIETSADTAIDNVAVTGTYTNNGILSVAETLSGTGELTNGAGGVLNLAGDVSISSLANAGTATKTGAGAMTTSLDTFTNTGTLNLMGTGTITGITNNAGGTVNLVDSGMITAFHNATATSVLNVSDLTPPGITTLTVSASGNTVKYSGDGNQPVESVTYDNLILSGSGTKSISMPDDSALANGNLSIAPTGTAKAAITGANLAVHSLTLGSSGKSDGTWGSSGSAAENQDDNFFDPTGTGNLTVTTDSRLSQTVSFTSTAPSDAVVDGPTYSPAATATSDLPVAFTIDASAAAVCSMSAGTVSFHAAGTCVINADQTGSENFKAAPQVQQSFGVEPASPVAQVLIAGDEMTGSPFSMVHGASMRKNFASVNAGPVQIRSNFEIFAAQRVIYKVRGVPTSFSEMMGLPESQLDTLYWLPWYNNKTLNTQLRIANPSDSQRATVYITIGRTPVPGSPFTLRPGSSLHKAFIGIDKGPVRIESDIPVIASERVIYKVRGVPTSSSEMMAVPDSQLDTLYWLPWYNNKTLDTQLRIANPSETRQASVHISIGGTPAPGSPFTLRPGASLRKVFTGIDKGPVRIESNIPIVAAERVIYKVRGVPTSFSEMMAVPDSQLDTLYWLPWYNNKTLDTQLRIANPSHNQQASVHISIGGTPVPGSPFSLRPGASLRKVFTGIDKGPVKIESNIPIVAAERVIYKVRGVPTSFSEMMAMPDRLLDLTFWFPSYNNVDLDTQLRFGLP